MPKLYFVLVIGLFPGMISFGQQTLKGNIITSDTHQPVISANVFLSNTSVRTISDRNGTFSFNRFPEGRFDLIISFIGSETYIITLESNHLPANLEVVLKPKINELQEVTVEPYEKNGWDKWGTFFIENFIGSSAFATDCKLLNHGMVKFRFNKKQNTLKAFTDDRIVIENKALGYVIKYELIKFEYNFTTKMFYYQGYPLFEEMETGRSGVKKRWMLNREDAYFGSMMHFMRCVYRNRLTEGGFEIRKLIVLSEAEKKRVQAIYQSQFAKSVEERKTFVSTKNMGIKNEDSAAYYRKVIQQPDEMSVLINKILLGDSIAYAIDTITAGLKFTDHLQVRYPAKMFPDEYGRSALRSVSKGPITSDIFLSSGKPLVVLANGSYFQGIDLISSGYWAWSEKIASMLPFDYWPPPKNKASTGKLRL